jgi:hypothetical protein
LSKDQRSIIAVLGGRPRQLSTIISFSRFPWDITLVNIFQVSRDMKALHSTIRQWRELHEQ